MQLEQLDQLLDEMIVHQRRKVLGIAKELDPRFSEDDLLNPHDFEALATDMSFNYEDGVYNGLLAVRAAVRAKR